MKFKIMFFALLLVLAGLVVAQSPEPQDEEAVRGAFLTTRPKEKSARPSAGTKPSRRHPKATTSSSGGSTSGSGSASAGGTGTGGDKTGASSKPVSRPLGVGFTLFMRDANGLAVRADPSRQFVKGDRVRILLETNADGYLYIYNSTDDGAPVMIYPDAELDEAGNYIQSHVPFEIPSSVATEERLRWFAFDEVAGTEHLYFVFTREPLDGVPIEDDLISYCHESSKPCPWRPTAELWARIQKDLNAALKIDRATEYGAAQTTSEVTATTRGLGLSREDPEPSLIMMAASTNTKYLVTVLDLFHK